MSSLSVPTQQAFRHCVEVDRFGMDEEIDRLRREKHFLMMELVKLRKQQLNTRACLQAMEERLHGTEAKQRQMMAFLARAMQNPAFVQQLLQLKEKRKELEEGMSKKRRKPIDQGRSGLGIGESSRGGKGRIAVESEPLEFEEYGIGYGVSELDVLAMEMQGFGRGRREEEEARDVLKLGSTDMLDRELDEGFWEELFSEKFESELRIAETEGDGDEDVDVLADRLGYLGSSPNKSC